VGADVPGQLAVLGKRLGARGALERLLLGVRADVRGKVGVLGKRLGAERTLLVFFFESGGVAFFFIIVRTI
jgi:hypothetical protein